MCELPRRSWKRLVSPLRIVLSLAALVAFGVGNLGLVLVGAALLLAAVVLPTVQQLEFGFPVGLKVTAAVHDREAGLRQEFESQRGTYELCAQLLSEDPALAARLLEAAWARTAAEWRRPVGPALRTYVLCVLVHLLIEEHHGGDTGPLGALALDTRLVVVLHSFADLTPEQIAQLLERPEDEVETQLRSAELVLTGRPSGTDGDAHA